MATAETENPWRLEQQCWFQAKSAQVLDNVCEYWDNEVDMARRRLEYVERSQRDLSRFPGDVQEVVVFALLEAQDGHKHEDAKPLTGFHGADVLEVALTFKTDTYRVVYTIDFPGVV